MIQEAVVRSWVQSGDALICARCNRAYIPSRTSDPDLCAMCYPARNIELGDGSVRRPKCEHCNGDIRGRRGDSKYCSDSCKTLACRKRKSGNAEAMQEGIDTAQEGEHIAEGVIRKQLTPCDVCEGIGEIPSADGVRQCTQCGGEGFKEGSA